MGCAASSQPQPERPARRGHGVGEAQDAGHLVPLEHVPKRLDELQGHMTSLTQSVAQLTQLTNNLQRENDNLKLQLPCSRTAGGLRAASPVTASASSRHQSAADPGALPGGWSGENEEEALLTAPPAGTSNKQREGGKLRTDGPGLAAALTRLEAQLSELGGRMGRVEGSLAAMECMREAWEAQRAAEEFARQIRKLEEVGIPTQSRRTSGPPSGTSTAAMSFADDLPPLDGLPQMRYPRQPPTPGSRNLASRRGLAEAGSTAGSSGGGGRGAGPRSSSSRQGHKPTSGGGAGPGSKGTSGGGAGNGGMGRAVHPMLPIVEVPISEDRSSNTGSRRGATPPAYGNGPAANGPGLTPAPTPAVGNGANNTFGRLLVDVASSGRMKSGSECVAGGDEQARESGAGGMDLLSPSSSTQSAWGSSKPVNAGGSPATGLGQGGMGNPTASGLNSTYRYSHVTPSDHAMVRMAGSGVRTAF